MNDSVLVIASHPDDEVLGCGGTITRLGQEGCSIHIAILGEGITSRYSTREEAEPALLHALHARSHDVKTALGARELRLFDLPDNRFDTVPLLSIVKIVEELLERLKPATIFTHHAGDLNMDHVITHRAVLTATRPISGGSINSLYAFEIASSTEWAFQQFSPFFRPNTFFDIETTLEEKIRAMQIYDSEARPFPHPRSPEALRATARRWGSAIGLKAAEAFELIRAVR